MLAWFSIILIEPYSMTPILSQSQDLLNTLKELMPTVYQQETLESILAMFLEGQGHSLPHHCTTKSESAISRFFNHYQWSTRSVIRAVRQDILNLILSVFALWAKTHSSSDSRFDHLGKSGQVSSSSRFGSCLSWQKRMTYRRNVLGDWELAISLEFSSLSG